MAKYNLYLVTHIDCGHVYKIYYRQLNDVAVPCEFWSITYNKWLDLSETFAYKSARLLADGATVKLIGIGVST